jgi:glycosyltransferase involved in cell wall biosynthesis
MADASSSQNTMVDSALPKISVITPAFRSARLIEETIRSVLDQEYPNLEYIVLDGAGDDTYKILQRYDHRLSYWRSHADSGQYQAINEGFARATGDIFCWLNSDDLLLPRSLFVVGEIFAQLPHVKWISTLKPGLWDANSYLSDVGRVSGFSREAFLDGLFLPGTRPAGHWIQQESTFFKRNLWELAGSRIPDYPLAGDFALWCEFYKHEELFGVDYPLAGFRVIQGQRSEAMDEYVTEAVSALNATRQLFGWKDNPVNSLRFSRYVKLPKIGTLTRNKFGYRGHRIVNTDFRKPGATWVIQDYSFLPGDLSRR